MVKYITFNYPAAEPGSKTLLTGIRLVDGCKRTYFISGFYSDPEQRITAFVYKGPLVGNHKAERFHTLAYPSAPGATVDVTSLYGPDNAPNDKDEKDDDENKCEQLIRVVGNYSTVESGHNAFGCLYQGALDGTGEWRTIVPQPLTTDPVLNTIAHSTNGGLVVGNYDTQLQQGKAFLYDIKTEQYYAIEKPNAISITAYGIWHDCGHQYTIAGGYADVARLGDGVSAAYLVDWDHKKKRLSNWRTFFYDNDKEGSLVTHFDGITGDGECGYYLTGDWIGKSSSETPPAPPVQEKAFFAHVVNSCAKKAREWREVAFPGAALTSGNSIACKNVIGVYTHIENSIETINGYVAKF
jgi:hypothetical protein